MTPALIAAVKVCIAVGTPQYIIATNPPEPVMSYPAGYEYCPALIAERNSGEAADRAARDAKALTEQRDIYLRGVRELKQQPKD